MKRASHGALILCQCFLSISTLAASGKHATIVPPLHTDGYQIVDAAGHTVRLTSVNWYGFDQKEYVVGGLDHAPLEAIIAQIQQIGVNSVRLPWANETLEHNPLVPDYAVAANPQFKGKHAMAVMDAVIAALARAHILIILDNHMSNADWCCSETDGNGLWYNREYPEANWLADWQDDRAPLSQTALGHWRGSAQRTSQWRGLGWRGSETRLACRGRARRQGCPRGQPSATHHGGKP